MGSFMNLIKPAVGPVVNLSEEEKKQINIEIDQKMAEL
jgi:hypothetical protein